MTPIIPPDLIQNIFDKSNATGLINKTNANATEEEARQKAQEYTKDIMQSYVARGQESHNFFLSSCAFFLSRCPNFFLSVN